MNARFRIGKKYIFNEDNPYSLNGPLIYRGITRCKTGTIYYRFSKLRDKAEPIDEAFVLREDWLEEIPDLVTTEWGKRSA